MRNPFFLLLVLMPILMNCEKVATPSDLEAPYREPYRPQFHFSPLQKWMNDPNGMVYYNGEYHLFYQYYPDSTVWGPMHWGHAISRDLVHWEQLPIALYPDEHGWIFSGSTVVDWENTSGLGQNGLPPLVAIFTYHDSKTEQAGRIDFQTQGIAYSNDQGRTWTKYPGNPVLKNPGIRDFRDPKVFWYEPTKQWIMSLAVQDRIAFYASPDLKNWTYQSEFGKDRGAHGGVWECPDLFPLTVEGATEVKWVLLVSINPGGPNGGSATQYFIGDFDGKTFTSDYSPDVIRWLDYGRDNYAGVTWSDILPPDRRRLFIGWMSNWQYATVVPTEKWRSAMTIPRQLTLRCTADGIYLAAQPVREMEKLRTGEAIIPPQRLKGAIDLTQRISIAPSQMEAILEFELLPSTTPNFGLMLSNAQGNTYRVGYNAASRQFYSDRTQSGKRDFSEVFADQPTVAPRLIDNNIVRLHLFFDAASAELFADEGLTNLSNIFFPREPYREVKLFVENGAVQLRHAVFYPLTSIWQK